MRTGAAASCGVPSNRSGSSFSQSPKTKLAAKLLSRRRGLMQAYTGHADQAARNIGETAFELTTGYLLLQDDYAPLVEANEVERVLAEVDSDCRDDSSCLLRCAHGMLLERCFTPPSHSPADRR